MDGHDRDGDIEARQGQGDETRPPQGAGGGRDARGVWSCALSGGAIAAIVVGYLVAVKFGMIATVFCTPFFVAGLLLSLGSPRKGADGHLGRVGLALSVGGAVVSWLLFVFIMLTGFFLLLNPSFLDDLGPLAWLNWE